MKFTNFYKNVLIVLIMIFPLGLMAQITDFKASKPLNQLQQKFVDLRFGMFIHYNIPTYVNADWPDPEASPKLFNPKHLNADQWAKAAKSANMSYGCLTTKHHSGFCIWDTKSTDYNVMNSPYGKDVVKQFADAFRANGLKVMLYYSILDTHHKLRPNQITPQHIDMVKQQITELLTKYGKIEALIIDGWDAPWSRISYDDVPFEDIYNLIKTLQPDCLVMDLNGAKYPAEGLYYTDIKTYEMGAGQRMPKDSKVMPTLACLPINTSWFWKTDFPTVPVRKPQEIVDGLIKPLNDASCNFILNVAPNRDGLIDDNAIAALKEVGVLWKNTGSTKQLPPLALPIISSNIAINKPANSSWSDDMNIMDFANDDNYGTSWQSNGAVEKPWFEVNLKNEQAVNMIVVAEGKSNIETYALEYWNGVDWKKIFDGKNEDRIKIHRFDRIWASKLRIRIGKSKETASIAEFQVFNERR
ncbi:carbohydrate-binding protein [Pedobacter frigidisoli]|uniref:alpha-L-fucosidase n=1 Tax=Pedobacter frigidisoli TaxID=2530455 RepID=A0A4R0P8Y0_9SPHI|nr:alpha-L-fucosidase [Pedobacter frigidisoli]TCD12046.1 carbohydrate-binding protein [Pedobacter frigidisoli]